MELDAAEGRAGMILTLDPSSTRIGWALWQAGRCVRAGAIKPRRAKDQALDRIDWMVDQLQATIGTIVQSDNRRRPIVTVIEVTSGKVNARRHGGGGAGLAIYGDAVGSVRTMLRLSSDVKQCIRVFENRWIGGFDKAKRRRVAAAEWIHYDRKTDPGADIADAIALGAWWRDIGSKAEAG